jgi:HAE1 family hydrophobic/amphiphilic exporter-1
MSLGGIALGAGMLIDNSIICLENIHRLRAEGLSPLRAAGLGARQVAVPIVGSTLTTCAVFGPLAWVPGTLGQLFRDQALAVSLSLGVSIIVALTLLPTLAARLGSSSVTREWMPLYGAYHRALVRLLERRWLTLGGLGLVILASAIVLVKLPREIFPPVHTENVELSLVMPSGTDVSGTDAAVREIERWLEDRPEVSEVLVSVGAADAIDPSRRNRESNRATVRARLHDDAVAERGALTETLFDRFASRPGWHLELATDRPELAVLAPEGEATLVCELTGPDPVQADALAQALAENASGRIGPLDAPLELAGNESEPRVRLNAREEAFVRLGVSESEAIGGVRATTTGVEAMSFRRFDEEDPVVIRTASKPSPAEEDLVVSGRSRPLRSMFDVTTELAPAEIRREDQARVATIEWNGSIREAPVVRAALEAALAEAPLPRGYTAHFRGASDELQDVLAAIAGAFALAAGLVLLVLAAEFESIRLPLVVFSAVPLALIGVTVALLVTGGSLNVISGMGLVILIGIVDNDAILKVDLIRRFMGEGMPVRQAILAASRQRYRPILMTTATTGLALLPLIFGRGSELRSPMAFTVTGGLIAATILTLLVLPVILEVVLRAPRVPALAEDH